MALPVRVNEENYANLQQEADKEHRSATAQLNVILEQRYGTVETGGTPKNLHLGNLPKPEEAEYHSGTPQKIASEANASGVSPVADLFRDDTGKAGIDLEKPCCKNETQPCQHWVWDSQSGEGYVNRLSGRVMEVD